MNIEMLAIHMAHCLENASTTGNNKNISEKDESMANTANISINCISPVSSSADSGSSEEDDVVAIDDDMRV
jgi:hypothetical protein